MAIENWRFIRISKQTFRTYRSILLAAEEEDVFTSSSVRKYAPNGYSTSRVVQALRRMNSIGLISVVKASDGVHSPYSWSMSRHQKLHLEGALRVYRNTQKMVYLQGLDIEDEQ